MTTPQHESALSRWSHEHWLLAGLIGFLGTALIAIVPGFANAMREPVPGINSALAITIALPLPMIPKDQKNTGWEIVRVQSGQTLGAIFAQLNLSPALMQRLLDRTSAKDALTQLSEHQELAFEIDSAGQLKTLRFDKSLEDRVDLTVNGDVIDEQIRHHAAEHRIETASGTITSSLYADGARAGLSSGTINDMANIFKYDIDFVEDLRDGDTFQVVYDETWHDGQLVGSGEILAATFINRDERFTAFRFNRNGKDEYFDETGRPLRKVLLRIPIEFARLSSTFGMRKHPVLGRMRAHKGVDYAARTGTPIMAAGDGRIKFLGWKNGYGRGVEVDHGQGRSTFYGHMSSWGKYKVGQHVSQGSTIGYVGMSGLATGPHLHYEFRIGGRQVNPLTVTMPKPQPLSGAEYLRFRAATAPALAKLLLIEKTSRVASR